MNSTDHAHQKGDSVCRPTDWTDIVKFFLLNYGLHAVTVVQQPGSTRLSTIINTIIAILMPSAGFQGAFQVLSSRRRWGETDLQTARRVGALCMVIPSAVAEEFSDELNLGQIQSHLVQVHGQYPLTDEKSTDQKTRDPENNGERMLMENPAPATNSSRGGLVNGEKSSLQNDSPFTTLLNHCRLVMVPPHFDVFPLVEEAQPDPASKPRLGFIGSVVKDFAGMFRPHLAGVTELSLACNYNVVKIVSAIIQILYACFELYKARGDQIEKYGYAAYSLTLIPYILMSLINLFASLWAPQYPSRFLVYYRGIGPAAGVSRAKDTATGMDKEQPQPQVSSTESNEEIRPRSASCPSIRSLQSPPSKEAGASPNQDGKNDPAWWDEKSWRNTMEWGKVESEIAGAVGGAYGNLTVKPESEKIDKIHLIQSLFISLLSLSVLAAPYIIIQLLTGFKQGHSTLSQRSWVMSWITMGQVGASIAFSMMQQFRLHTIEIGGHSLDPIFAYFIIVMLLSPSTIGGFVVVAQMMSADQVCKTI